MKMGSDGMGFYDFFTSYAFGWFISFYCVEILHCVKTSQFVYLVFGNGRFGCAPPLAVRGGAANVFVWIHAVISAG